MLGARVRERHGRVVGVKEQAPLAKGRAKGFSTLWNRRKGLIGLTAGFGRRQVLKCLFLTCKARLPNFLWGRPRAPVPGHSG